MLLELAGAGALAYLLWLLLQLDPEPLYGVYSQPDALYINGTNKDGVCLVMRVGRRHNREAELWLSIKVPGMGFYQSPVHPDTKVYNTDGKGFNVGGLRFECLEPHKKWKINFNGILREGLYNTWSEKDKGKLVHVKFSFLWDAFSDVFDFGADSDPWLVADAIAREPWTSGFLCGLQKEGDSNHYEHWGELRGVLNIEGTEEIKLYLHGCRNHSYGQYNNVYACFVSFGTLTGVRDWGSFHRYIVHRGWVEDGSTFDVTVSSSSLLSYLQCGYVNRPNSIQHPISSVGLSMPNLGESGTPPQDYGFNFRAGGKRYHVQVKGNTTPVYYHGRDWNSITHEMMCEFTVNGKKGCGMVEFCYRRAEGVCPVPHQESVPLLGEPKSLSPLDENALVFTLDQRSCCSSRLVGGKGSNLAMLTQMPTLDGLHFTVPPGFCLTLAAFAKHLQFNKVLDKQLADLSNVACGKKTGSLKEACDQTVAMFLEAPLCLKLQECIKQYLKQVFSDDWQQQRFAVRSSAAGEDTEELSSAGQMETVLGVKGLQQISEGVKKCWSSHFSFIAVEYRRQHGQIIYSPVGVVIQKMVPAEAAGVLFTRHPLTGNPQYTTINANYGLGESVVSGSSQPDLITVKKDLNDNLEIVSKEVGRKKTQVTMAESGGTVESEVTEGNASKCCISDDIIIQLTGIGIQLEKYFSDPRDIEWAVTGGQIHLLQARPITILDQETEWELFHEFDTPISTNKEVLTRHNIAEVMPGSSSPLGLSVAVYETDQSAQTSMVKGGIMDHVKPYNRIFGICCNQPFLNLTYLEGFYEGNILGADREAVEVALCGEPVKDLSTDDVRDFHGSLPWYSRIVCACKYWKNAWDAIKMANDWANRLDSYKLHLDNLTAKEVFEVLRTPTTDFRKCQHNHTSTSVAPVLLSTIVTKVLTGGAAKMETEHYADLALLFSNCGDVFSAEVPAAIQKLTYTIRKSTHAQGFVDMEPKDALMWLKSDESGEAGRHFEDFITRHGYRCIKELELHEQSWQSEPSKIIKTLQAMLRAPIGHDSSSLGVEDTEEAIAKLKTPITAVGRQVLKFILPRARRAVGDRERGKAVTIRMFEHLRQGYWKLAQLMVEEGRIPDTDLLFYFSRTEIGRLLETRSSRLIARAQRRRRLQPKLEKIEFPLIEWGHPTPLEEKEEEGEDLSVTSLKVTGTPVSQGAAKGTARVIVTLDNADTIKAGEILVVKSTNVGWSPYFPLISGLVTELGGLGSHGAVVAREYGTPCVVNVNKATSLFKSGDRVLLNGTTGTFEKIKE